jgi:hypothetical protein
VVVEPEQRSRHLRRLVRVQQPLRLAEPETIGRDCRAAVAVGGDEATVQMGHETHLIAERREARVYR